ncbi:MAG: phenylalanine--tRNA ligase subunit alpha [Rhodothermales bacterium]
MLENVDDIRRKLESEPIDSEETAEEFRIKYLGRKSGLITDLFKEIRNVEPADRAAFGQQVNALKQLAEQRLEHFEANLRDAETTRKRNVDLTLPGRPPAPRGSIHPITQTLEDIKRVFARFGFAVAEGPEIESEWYNFTALNFPPDHPARDMQDTFFVEADRVVLRTHTSPVQIRILEKEPPPVRVIVPGRVYRNEAISYKSYCLFHQVEGLYVDEGVTFADLKHVLHVFAQALFGSDVRMRFRPSFFPFTEPSAEVDIWWADDALPDGGRWLEILGCGMVDPNVFDSVDVDAERYTGYAFGMGVERIAMLRYGIDDIRIFYENDARFLDQF